MTIAMLHKMERKTSEGEANPTPAPLEADPGARSAGDPTPVSGCGMGPVGVSSFTLTRLLHGLETHYPKRLTLAQWLGMD